MDMIREGDLYKVFEIEGTIFEIRYGYYSEAERERWRPTPIFPDFTRIPAYTPAGQPFVTAEADVCIHYAPKPRVSGEDWCNDCMHFSPGEEIIGVCKCEARRQGNQIKI